MPIYTATFSAVAVTAAQDVFEIVSPSNSRIAIRKVIVGQYTDFGDAAAEILSILIIRGFTTTGSGGSAVVGKNVQGHTGAPTTTAVIAANNTTVALNGTGVTLIADTINIAAGWIYDPPPEERLIVDPSVRLVVRITAPADSITMNGTLIYEELGQG